VAPAETTADTAAEAAAETTAESTADATADTTDISDASVGESGLEPASVLDAQAPVAEVGAVELPPEEPALDDGVL
jgi:hypothetical protein